jgi:hypothetical protein
VPRPLFLILPWRIVTIHAPGVGRAMCRENPPAGRRMAWIRRRSSRGIETFRMSPPPVGIGVGDQAGDDGPKGSTCEVTHRGGGRSRGEIVTGILPRFCRKSPKTNPVADRCVEDAAPDRDAEITRLSGVEPRRTSGACENRDRARGPRRHG